MPLRCLELRGRPGPSFAVVPGSTGLGGVGAGAPRTVESWITWDAVRVGLGTGRLAVIPHRARRGGGGTLRAVPARGAQTAGGAIWWSGSVGFLSAVEASVAGACRLGAADAVAVLAAGAWGAVGGAAEPRGVAVRPQGAGLGVGAAAHAKVPLGAVDGSCQTFPVTVVPGDAHRAVLERLLGRAVPVKADGARVGVGFGCAQGAVVSTRAVASRCGQTVRVAVHAWSAVHAVSENLPTNVTIVRALGTGDGNGRDVAKWTVVTDATLVLDEVRLPVHTCRTFQTCWADSAGRHVGETAHRSEDGNSQELADI